MPIRFYYLKTMPDGPKRLVSKGDYISAERREWLIPRLFRKLTWKKYFWRTLILWQRSLRGKILTTAFIGGTQCGSASEVPTMEELLEIGITPTLRDWTFERRARLFPLADVS